MVENHAGRFCKCNKTPQAQMNLPHKHMGKPCVQKNVIAQSKHKQPAIKTPTLVSSLTRKLPRSPAARHCSRKPADISADRGKPETSPTPYQNWDKRPNMGGTSVMFDKHLGRDNTRNDMAAGAMWVPRDVIKHKYPQEFLRDALAFSRLDASVLLQPANGPAISVPCPPCANPSSSH